MKITLATHYGMCFGVKDALRKTQEMAAAGPVTVLGQLVHNPVVREDLQQRGVQEGDLFRVGQAPTREVIITAHGASDKDRGSWREAGFRLTDTTCPLVRKAHTALAQLVAEGCKAVIIGQRHHVEVRGLAGDFPTACVIEEITDLDGLPEAKKFGIVCQTTQPLDKVHAMVRAVRQRFPNSEVIFRDTVCQPTKDRQSALEALCRENEVIVIVGGANSNNTRQLALTARSFGATAYQVERAADLDPAWFRGVERVGLTAGTSTLESTVEDVARVLREEINGAISEPDRRAS